MTPTLIVSTRYSEFATSSVQCKVEAFSGYCLLFCLNRSFVKLALDIPSGIQGLEMPWPNRLENDAVGCIAVASRYTGFFKHYFVTIFS